MSGDPVIIVFGEDDNDREAIKHLIQALWPDAPRIEKRNYPILLMKSQQSKREGLLSEALKIVRAEKAKTDAEIIMVVTHEDCDKIEPAHESLAELCEQFFSRHGVKCIGAVAAWEIEAWWYLWPSAVLAVNQRWKNPGRQGKEVGLIENAKEALIADLRPKPEKGKRGPIDYRESDAPKIACKVRELCLVDDRKARSKSFDRFADRIKAWASGTPIAPEATRGAGDKTAPARKRRKTPSSS